MYWARSDGSGLARDGSRATAEHPRRGAVTLEVYLSTRKNFTANDEIAVARPGDVLYD